MLEHHGGLSSEAQKRIQELEDELIYIKRHSEMENGLLRDENEILKKEVEQYVSVQQMVEGPQHNQSQYHHTPNAKH